MNKKISKRLKKFTDSRTEGQPKEYKKRLYNSLKKEYLKASGRDKQNIRREYLKDWT